MRVTYIGAHLEVAVPLTYGGEIVCAHGDAIDVPDELAARLLEQETNWRLAPSELAKVTRAERKAEERAEDAAAADGETTDDKAADSAGEG